MALCPAHRRRNRRLDDFRQLSGGLNGRLLPGLDNALGDPPGAFVLAIAEDDVRQLLLAQGVHQVPGCGALLAHAHIQGGVVVVGKAPLRRVQLVGGHPDVQEHPVHRVHALGPGKLPHLGEVAPHPDGLGVFPQPLPGSAHGVWVLVDGEQAPCGQLLHNGLGVAAAPHGAIYVQALWPDGQRLYRLLK